ncbi:MAG: 2-C-methyl-D-erythritol 4-phosphate cytidylyltransferase [Burkholderiaceae bacterium]
MTDPAARAAVALPSVASRVFALLPAGGAGTRLGAPLPKQYLPLAGRMMLDWTLAPFVAADWIAATAVVVAAGDPRVDEAVARYEPARRDGRLIVAPVGGASRRDSVFNGLAALRARFAPADDDWVLVHDAARPGLRGDVLRRLRDALLDDPVGGLLALPVVDTVKRADAGGRVARTVPRDGLWLAQTPQMFRFGKLFDALARFPDVTDEAAAIEAAGLAPRLIEGGRDNFKVTSADDLQRMAAVLAARSDEPGEELR